MSAKIIAILDGAPPMRCECCIRTARRTVVLDLGKRRIEVACCTRHAKMAMEQMRRFLAHKANRNTHFAAQLAEIGDTLPRPKQAAAVSD